jgi:hypothetical protein
MLSGPRSRLTAAQKDLTTAEIEPGTPVLVARNSDHQTTEAVTWSGKEKEIYRILITEYHEQGLSCRLFSAIGLTALGQSVRNFLNNFNVRRRVRYICHKLK